MFSLGFALILHRGGLYLMSPGLMKPKGLSCDNRQMICLTFLFIAALGVVIALMALMGLFLGAAGPDLRGLLIMLLGGLPLILLATFVYLRRLQAAVTGSLLSEVWRRTPRWLLVAFALVFSLIVLAELAVFLVQYLSGVGVTWEYYIPIIGGSIYAISFCCLYAYWNYRANY